MASEISIPDKAPSLRPWAARALAYANRLGSFVINLGSIAILARLLPPHQFGLVAMITTTTGLLGTFREFGMSAAAVQAPNLSEEARDSIFWYSFLATSVVTAALLLLAPVVAEFYQEPRVAFLLRLAAIGFFISGISVQHNALLRRSLSFGAIFVADIGGLLVGTVVAIVTAAYTGDAISLIAGTLANALYSTAVTMLLGGWLPSAPRNLHLHLSHAAFGARVSTFTILNYLTNNIAAIVIGRWSDAASMGFFNRAQSLYALPRTFILGPILQVQFPLLCRALGKDEETRRIYAGLLLLTGITFIPAGAALPFLAVDLTRIVLGEQWTEAGRILAWFAPGMIAIGLTSPFGEYLTSQGRVTELGRWGFGDLAIRGGGAAFGAMFGAQQAAAGFSLSTLLIATPIVIWITVRRGPFRLRDYFEASYPGLLMGVTTLFAAWLCRTIFPADGLGSLAILLSVCAATWIGTMLAVGRTRGLLLEFISRSRNAILVEK